MDFVGRKHLQGSGECGLGKRVGINTKEEGPIDALLFPISANPLRDRKNVPLVESAVERRPAMAGRSKCDALLRNFGIGTIREIRRNQPRNVDKVGWLRGLAGHWIDRHRELL
jgi:hypothetical protein